VNEEFIQGLHIDLKIRVMSTNKETVMKSVTVINVLTIKPGKMEEFIKEHEAFSRDFGRTCSGLVGGRMYRSSDGKTAMLVSEFESKEAAEQVRNLPAVRDNVKKLQAFVDDSKPLLYETAFAYGPSSKL
jgi:quinol monooxygenase YgiN